MCSSDLVIYCCLYFIVQSSSVEILGLVASKILRLYPRHNVVENEHGIRAYLSYFKGQLITVCTTKQLRGSCGYLDHGAEGSTEDMEMWSRLALQQDWLGVVVDWW